MFSLHKFRFSILLLNISRAAIDVYVYAYLFVCVCACVRKFLHANGRVRLRIYMVGCYVCARVLI